MKGKKYVWGSAKRKRMAKAYTIVGFLGLIGILISVASVLLALFFCWMSVMYFIMARGERVDDRFEKLEADKNGKKK